MKTLGVIGGMGPAATLDFLARLYAATPATRDQDHLRVITDSNPHVPDRNAARRGEGPSPGPVLAAMARGLEAAGADLLVMPCNAAHGWAGEIRAAVSIPFVSMIDVAVGAVTAARPGGGRVRLLAVDATLAGQLYQPALATAGFAVSVPDVADFMALVYRIKAGDTGAKVRAAMAEMADGDATADVILVACTEVPLVLNVDAVRRPLVSATDALVAAVLRDTIH